MGAFGGQRYVPRRESSHPWPCHVPLDRMSEPWEGLAGNRARRSSSLCLGPCGASETRQAGGSLDGCCCLSLSGLWANQKIWQGRVRVLLNDRISGGCPFRSDVYAPPGHSPHHSLVALLSSRTISFPVWSRGTFEFKILARASLRPLPQGHLEEPMEALSCLSCPLRAW